MTRHVCPESQTSTFTYKYPQRGPPRLTKESTGTENQESFSLGYGSQNTCWVFPSASDDVGRFPYPSTSPHPSFDGGKLETEMFLLDWGTVGRENVS